MLMGLLALLPAALNTSPARAGALAVAVCSGDGLTRTISLPLSGEDPPGREQPGCCAKGCHTGSRKKSAARQIDTRQ
ncbi:hypothetical protein ACFOON_02685 [Novosphingobium piscinae]|uniref:DUF2946 domain-containing protein n=1 Tax=Novosphingobium piscinae TaxID=1507448 RepID=A0A7X1KRE1_9SPHN|nr:hypothetical protein [Novosphingobium piscinae]MBC2670709.1 hypothetical protein [Novosphingobium piscinae]